MTGIDPKAGLALAGAAATDGASGLRDRLTAAAQRGDTEGVREAAQKFEQYFVQTMLTEMRKAADAEEGLLSGSEMETFGSLFDEEIAGRIAHGRGIGLAAMIETSLARAYGAGGVAGAAVSGPPGAGGHRPAPVSAREGWSWPLPAEQPGRISSDFGRRADPLHGGARTHRGLDVAAPAGTPVLSMAAGTVVRAAPAGGFGNLVEVEHEDGARSRYAHQARIDVAVGDRVAAGQQLGTVGATGRATGPHLHVEVHTATGAIDPEAWLRGE